MRAARTWIGGAPSTISRPSPASTRLRSQAAEVLAWPEVAPLADRQQPDHHPALSAGPSADDEQLDRVAQAAALGEPAPERDR